MRDFVVLLKFLPSCQANVLESISGLWIVRHHSVNFAFVIIRLWVRVNWFHLCMFLFRSALLRTANDDHNDNYEQKRASACSDSDVHHIQSSSAVHKQKHKKHLPTKHHRCAIFNVTAHWLFRASHTPHCSAFTHLSFVWRARTKFCLIIRKAMLTVVGSSNIDLITYCQRMPVLGETLRGDKFEASSERV